MLNPKAIFLKSKLAAKKLTGNKGYWDKLAEERNKEADKKMWLNRLPNAATGYQDWPNNR
jgi:hypothetical protein